MAKTRKAKANTARHPGLGKWKIAIGVAVAAKLVLGSAWLVPAGSAQARGGDALGPVGAPSHPALEPVPVSVKRLERPGSHQEARALLEALSRRQADLQRRERDLVAREDRIEMYEKDLGEKIAHLESLQKEMARDSKVASDADSEAASSLAKVYAAMKPSEAAPLLDRLDDQTVLRILAHMRAKQIGELLPLLDRDKAIVLTQALAGG